MRHKCPSNHLRQNRLLRPSFHKFRSACNSSLSAHIGKCSVTIVVVKQMPSCREAARTALDGHAFPITIDTFAGRWSML